MSSPRNLESVLQSTSEYLFPAELGDAKVHIDSTSSEGDTPLHVVIWNSDTKGALLLIEGGINLNAIGEMGETPFHVAIGMKNINIINALLKAGAKTNIVSEFGETVLEKASKVGINLIQKPNKSFELIL